MFKNSPKKRIYKNYDKISYKVIKNIRNLEKTKFNNFKIPFNFIQRIKYRDRFHFIYKKKFLISYGWSTNRKKFFISETQCFLKNKNNVIFYDFKTLKDFQNKGFYKTLLYFMLQKFSSKSCYIYSLSSNRKSISAILSVGFEPIKKLTFFSEKNSSIRLN